MDIFAFFIDEFDGIHGAYLGAYGTADTSLGYDVGFFIPGDDGRTSQF